MNSELLPKNFIKKHPLKEYSAAMFADLNIRLVHADPCEESLDHRSKGRLTHLQAFFRRLTREGAVQCVFRPYLDTHSGKNWTVIPGFTGHSSHKIFGDFSENISENDGEQIHQEGDIYGKSNGIKSR